MNKIWKPTEPGSDKLIVVKDQIIYKGNPSNEDLNSITLNSDDLETTKKIFSFPFSYIKKIENQRNKNTLKFYIGSKTEEEIKILNNTQKNEIFNFLRLEIPQLRYKSIKPTFFKYAKNQIFAILILSIIYSLTYYYAIELENKGEYAFLRSNNSIFTLAFLLAKIGSVKLTIGYVLLLILAVYSLIKKEKSRDLIETIER